MIRFYCDRFYCDSILLWFDSIVPDSIVIRFYPLHLDDEKSRQLAAYRRKLADYREVETKLRELRKRVSPFRAFNSCFHFRKQKCKRITTSPRTTSKLCSLLVKSWAKSWNSWPTRNSSLKQRTVLVTSLDAVDRSTKNSWNMVTLFIVAFDDCLGHSRRSRHDHAYHYASVATRSRSVGVQDEPRRPRKHFVRWSWRSCRANPWASWSRRVALLNPDLFKRVGITPPKGCLLYGPPGITILCNSVQSCCLGTGKTLLARAVASQLDCNFLKVVSSAIVDKYIGESARMIREMFNYARDHQPCVVFFDEIDAIGGRRFSEGTSADREIQRTLMELLNQMDGFDSLGKVKIIMATNRPDTLDPLCCVRAVWIARLKSRSRMRRVVSTSSKFTPAESPSMAKSTTKPLWRCLKDSVEPICVSSPIIKFLHWKNV